VETQIFKIDFDNSRVFTESGLPMPAASIVVIRESCKSAGGVPYHWYRVLYEDASGRRRGISETSDPNSVVSEVNRQMSRMPSSYRLSIWYNLPPPGIQSVISRDEFVLHSEICKWARQEAERIDKKVQSSRLPVEWTDEVGRASYYSHSYKPGGSVGHRLDIVLLRIVKVDSKSTIQFRYRLLRETWSRRGLLGWLTGHQDEEMVKEEPVLIPDRSNVGLEMWSLGLELEKQNYTKAGHEQEAFNRILAADSRLLEEIERNRKARVVV
jgi:hypothetical protein